MTITRTLASRGGGWSSPVVTRPVVRIHKLSTKCSNHAMLRSIGLAMCRHSFLKVVKPGKNKGAALVEYVLKLLGPATKGVACCKTSRSRLPTLGSQFFVNCLPRCGAVSHGFPVSMRRMVLSKLDSGGSLVDGFATQRRRGIRTIVTHVKLRNLRGHTVKRLDNKRLRHTLLKHTVIDSPSILVLSRPDACVSGHFRTHLCRLLTRVGGRYTVVLIDRSVNAMLRRMGSVTYIGRALSCRPSTNIAAR